MQATPLHRPITVKVEASIYRLRTRDLLILCVLGLICLGVVMVQSASTDVTKTVGWQWNQRGAKNLIFAIAGVTAFFSAGFFDYAWLIKRRTSIWKSPILWLLVLAAFANLIVLVPHIGLSVNGARRWLPLGPLQVQPSEIAKWAIVIFLAYWLTQRPPELAHSFLRGYLPMLVPIAVICLLIVIQDFGTATLIILCSMMMMLAGRVKLRYLSLTIPPAAAAGLWFLMHKAYRWKRVTAFLNPWADPQKEGYHMIQSLLSFATGGVTGRGLGNGIQKLGYLPEDTTDFIFAVICEELGLFGALLTVMLYLGVVYVTWQTLREKKDNFGRMLAFGIGTMVSLQGLINIAVATVSVPTKGLSLPLVSAGGSGLVITSAALGLLLSVCRHEHPEEVPAPSLPMPLPVPLSEAPLKAA
jgi:cell division protein FtsW